MVTKPTLCVTYFPNTREFRVSLHSRHYYTNPIFRSSYTTFLLLIYIRLFNTPSKLKTYHNSKPSSGKNTSTAPCEANPRNSCLDGSTASRLKWSSLQDVLPSSHSTAWLHWKLAIFQIKILFHTKIGHGLIPCHWTFFITLTHEILVLYIAINSYQSWYDSQSKILCFMHPLKKNSNIPPSNTTWIKNSSYAHGRTGALNLTYLTVIDNGMDLTRSNTIPSEVKRQFKSNHSHTQDHTYSSLHII